MSDTATRSIGLQARVERLNEMILAGEILEAHNAFYAENCVQQENENDPCVGKEANRAREEEWLDNVTEFRTAEVLSVAVDEENDVTMTEWYLNYTHREWGHVEMHQVSVARWEDGQIVRERFYYDA